MRFTNTVSIQKPPPVVFGFLARLDNLPRWNYALSRVDLVTDGPIRTGTRIRVTRTLPRPGRDELEVVDLDPARRLTLRGDLGPLHGTLDYTLEGAPGGATLLRNTADVSPRGLARLLSPLLVNGVRSAVAANLDVMRQLVETEQ